ncbi:hypothetical protein E2C01_041876 [Portunus trituberculatus]|uniref:Uncharacterized protein n=1 Tax=Portunus trituberculatus TaxID=210409 RepID=A0A5B7FL04_PORTR|nr:hypothetical protein [Portunus trituberculatus]
MLIKSCPAPHFRRRRGGGGGRRRRRRRLKRRAREMEGCWCGVLFKLCPGRRDLRSGEWLPALPLPTLTLTLTG